MEAVANCALHKLGGNSRVDTTAHGTEDLALSNEFADSQDFLVDEIGHCPILLCAANLDGEVLKDLCAVLRVCNLWVQLEAVDVLALVADGSVFGVGGSGDGMEALWELGQLIAVGHPHLELVLEPIEQAVNMTIDLPGREIGMAKLSVDACNDVVLAAAVGNFLEAVAYSEDRYVQVEVFWVDMWRAFFVYAGGSTRQNDTSRLPVKVGQFLGAREHLRVDMEVSQAAGDQVSTREQSQSPNLEGVLEELDPGGHAYVLLRAKVQGENGIERLVRDHLRYFLRCVCHDVE